MGLIDQRRKRKRGAMGAFTPADLPRRPPPRPAAPTLTTTTAIASATGTNPATVGHRGALMISHPRGQAMMMTTTTTRMTTMLTTTGGSTTMDPSAPPGDPPVPMHVPRGTDAPASTTTLTAVEDASERRAWLTAALAASQQAPPPPTTPMPAAERRLLLARATRMQMLVMDRLTSVHLRRHRRCELLEEIHRLKTVMRELQEEVDATSRNLEAMDRLVQHLQRISFIYTADDARAALEEVTPTPPPPSAEMEAQTGAAPSTARAIPIDDPPRIEEAKDKDVGGQGTAPKNPGKRPVQGASGKAKSLARLTGVVVAQAKPTTRSSNTKRPLGVPPPLAPGTSSQVHDRRGSRAETSQTTTSLDHR